MQEKRQIIRESALELYPHTESATSVGGLDVLKAWLAEKRAGVF